MSEGVMSQVLGEQEAATAVSPRLRRAKRPIRVVDVGEAGLSEVVNSDTSTPVKSMLPIYSQRRSSSLDLPEKTEVCTRKRRVEVEVRDEDTPPCGRVNVEHLDKREGRSVPKTESNGFPEIEPLPRGLAC